MNKNIIWIIVIIAVVVGIYYWNESRKNAAAKAAAAKTGTTTTTQTEAQRIADAIAAVNELRLANQQLPMTQAEQDAFLLQMGI